ncbi:carbohydrate porin [Paucibacter sp. R3-3]|uniref:Carbohydrate porin n=1 Tax=Roseateles agri TaxID=3098619 RepID=A0ABU5DLX6_9BURK|nr:carbohydrate porin [Paucibacter sp. R3-3]MDY0747305.1 carbohydrate porin [Paucibacter sp. R3-3]
MRVQFRGLGLLIAFVFLTSIGCAARAQEAWNAHFQSTYVRQFKPTFHSPYAGPNSLSGQAETSYSFTGTAAFGLRLPSATEVYFDPEIAQGIAMSGLLGLAGFPNGELAKTSGDKPKAYVARLFARHTVELGGESQSLESSANQLGGATTANRLILTAGVLSVLDIFDVNAYAHDPRMQFMNWALMTHAAYDYAADSRGYTQGLAAEYIVGNWALRAGRFAVPKEPNQLQLDHHLFTHFSDQIEASHDYELAGQSGTVRLLMFRMRAVMARYGDALGDEGPPQPLADVRRGNQVKQGFGLNVEHHLSEDLGAFARAFRADGKTETYAFTEADASVSAGLQLKGSAWTRSDDVLGLGVARSSLAAEHRRYLQDGGATFFLGDGALRYRPEQDLELYYSADLAHGLFLTGDAQRIRNPGYNADRGPVSVYSIRLRWES